jgi:hypothetical protein
MAEPDSKLYPTIQMAFIALNAVGGFKLLFWFYYADGDGKDKATVIKFVNQYKSNPAYYQYNGKPLLSTFGGGKYASVCVSIKQQTGCFFMRSYSSMGAKEAMNTLVPDGCFIWAGWPWGNTDINDYVGASYKQFLGRKEYMMPISPWLYTNMPGFNKAGFGMVMTSSGIGGEMLWL